MKEGKIVLIRLPSEGDEGIGEKPVALLGSVMMQLILKAAFSREVQLELRVTRSIRSTATSFNTSSRRTCRRSFRTYGSMAWVFFLATQSFSNIKDEDIRTAILGVGTLLRYQTTEPDARIVAGEFRRGVELDEDWQPEIKTHIAARRDVSHGRDRLPPPE